MPQDPASPEISPEQVKRMLDAGEPFLLLDVREPDERAIASINGSILIPMGDIPARLYELREHEDRLVVAFCHAGIRSLNVAHYLLQQGFDEVASMAGGIDAWSTRIDPNVPRY
ncbi:rhodanese-like domain-containing protein [Mucisphaera calidilacus]|uniref:Putative adenylyltransferase/sulfurtransferase MoeZ n=1 Tax=Mucisphaera calidilacus TaxID=2527982 RepID=A0A518BYF8_9BACT|nr:rhodanese-like domain-containing protein [Mucisphaera calidilacus]QDU72002.1 putative adenylyltransferase/sulfurtransferase MoeZ [Mucisphaera calidilacus]